MTRKITTRVFLTAAAIVTVGMLQSANPSIHLTNVTGSALNFELQCEDDTVQNTWTIQPHATANIFCRNGARAANLRIYTDRSNGERWWCAVWSMTAPTTYCTTTTTAT
jgi:hypothetical protein